MQVNTGLSFEDPDQDVHVRRPNKKSWRGPLPHGATAMPAAAPLWIIHQELPHPRQTVIWDSAGHPSGTDWRLLPNDYYG